ncbi:hypothetical protein Acor_31600 [Acrocarpospora corrugata]|uniref:SH3b domain-containing protein n=1 Tax=Acrocarpospora corrugata TaxID=35763 RepID=A0A5M3VX69_9ACTN|nr:SH3 domain-containing protein [Acrocarpospora corrugata]GES01096.1 hypothetical protein Acor_31600 [Acrocarpospora corrugata]
MTLAERITPALTVCATIGWLLGTGLPAQAAARTADSSASSFAPVCTHQVTGVRAGSQLDVYSGAGWQFPRIGTLTADGRTSGDCTPVNGWTKVKASNGKAGWVPAVNLYKTSPPNLACTYRLTHVRTASYLNVRSGAGLRFRPIGRLTVAGGAASGECAPVKGWIKVKASNGKVGWSSAKYLRKVSGK